MIKRRDVLAQVSARLTSPLRSLPSMVKISQVIAEEAQEGDDAAADLILGRIIDNAEGAQLDQWGRVLGEARLGRADDEYAAALIVRVARNTSQGKPNELIRIVQAMIGSGIVEYREYVPAYGTVVVIDAAVGAGQRLAAAVAEQASAGGRIDLIAGEGPVFGFADSTAQPGHADHLAGFGDLNDANEGGVFTLLVR